MVSSWTAFTGKVSLQLLDCSWVLMSCQTHWVASRRTSTTISHHTLKTISTCPNNISDFFKPLLYKRVRCTAFFLSLSVSLSRARANITVISLIVDTFFHPSFQRVSSVQRTVQMKSPNRPENTSLKTTTSNDIS